MKNIFIATFAILLSTVPSHAQSSIVDSIAQRYQYESEAHERRMDELRRQSEQYWQEQRLRRLEYEQERQAREQEYRLRRLESQRRYNQY